MAFSTMQSRLLSDENLTTVNSVASLQSDVVVFIRLYLTLVKIHCFRTCIDCVIQAVLFLKVVPALNF